MATERTDTQILEQLEAWRRSATRRVAEVTALTTHPSPVVREEAVSLLASHWRAPSSRNIVHRLLTTDPDVGVRAHAVLGLAALSTPVTHSEDVGLLIGLVADSSLDEDVRRAAYEALCVMHGRLPPPVNRAFLVERDADLTWLAELRRR
jgi:HEAT repeat protein